MYQSLQNALDLKLNIFVDSACDPEVILDIECQLAATRSIVASHRPGLPMEELLTQIHSGETEVLVFTNLSSASAAALGFANTVIKSRAPIRHPVLPLLKSVVVHFDSKDSFSQNLVTGFAAKAPHLIIDKRWLAQESVDDVQFLAGIRSALTQEGQPAALTTQSLLRLLSLAERGLPG